MKILEYLIFKFNTYDVCEAIVYTRIFVSPGITPSTYPHQNF